MKASSHLKNLRQDSVHEYRGTSPNAVSKRKSIFEMVSKILAFAALLRLDKPIGIFLLLWPTLMALWIAGRGQPDAKVVLIFILGVVVMRSAGCGINDLADRTFDGQVERTRTRPLILKTVSLTEAYGLFGFLITLAFGLVWQLNNLTRWLSGIALTLAVVYPFMKRYMDVPQVVLGMAFGFAIPMAFAALNNTVPVEAWVLYLATLCWVVAYDTEYAMVDRKDDLKLGLKSTAILFGRSDRYVVFALQLGFLGVLVLLGWQLGFGGYYYAGMGVGLCCAVYQLILIFNRDPKRCFQAFLNNNFLGASLFLGLLLEYSNRV